MEQVAALFTDQQAAMAYFACLKKARPRYIRDQLLLVKKGIKKSNAPLCRSGLKHIVKRIKSSQAMTSGLSWTRFSQKEEVC